MIAILFLIIHSCAYLVHAGGSASAEAAAEVNPGMNGGAGAEAPNPGVNNLFGNGQTQLAQLVPVSPTFFIQQPGLPIGQVAVPVGSNMAMQQGGLALQQGGLTLPMTQQPMGIPQQQGQGTQLFAIVPVNTVGGPQIPGFQVPGLQVFNPAQQFQIVPLGGVNMFQPGMGAQTVQTAGHMGHAGHTVKQRSVPEETSPGTASSETRENSAVPPTWSPSLAKALKLPLLPPKVNRADPECSKNKPDVPENEIVTMEESSGLGETSWSEMTPIP
ncbi:hypothetical protein SKAU_G00391930 [Synaphobranchus kaupii]|uniref:Amelotin n=1 Tax=Synaphobranchus kaupii TaxID=118154 RepID=A0A9Q1IDQ6_SYNKA|nr:hypothetical protein SKAU_G00391930 [Synaphobranchus kaupii]